MSITLEQMSTNSIPEEIIWHLKDEKLHPVQYVESIDYHPHSLATVVYHRDISIDSGECRLTFMKGMCGEWPDRMTVALPQKTILLPLSKPGLLESILEEQDCGDLIRIAYDVVGDQDSTLDMPLITYLRDHYSSHRWIVIDGSKGNSLCIYVDVKKNPDAPTNPIFQLPTDQVLKCLEKWDVLSNEKAAVDTTWEEVIDEMMKESEIEQ